jgi:lipid-A-disaccharide synthase
MPGSRAYEVEGLVAFYFSVALQLQRERPEIPVALALSPFTARDSVRSAIESGGHPRMFGKRGKLVSDGGCDYLITDEGDRRIPVLRNALAAAKEARLVLTIPGTKTIELAILGKPMVAITPLNAPEVVTINGPLTYLDRIPFVGLPLKRAAVTAVSHRFKYHTQPNMDAGRTVVREIHSTITPARMARIALESYDDAAWLASVSPQLAALYRDHVGASARMAESLLELAA